MPNVIFKATLTGEDSFTVTQRADAALRECGFSVGRMQAHSPRGILFGDFDIQKWRNLDLADREALHGQVTHLAYFGTEQQLYGYGAEIVLFDRAPVAAARDLSAILVCAESTTIQIPPPQRSDLFRDTNRFGKRVKWRGTTGSRRESCLSISFIDTDGEITRLLLDFDSADKLRASINTYVPENTGSHSDRSSGIPISEGSSPQEGQFV
ncbi:hypothetical protein [Brucella anthropi]|uniref:hypothetical protein n=1 Tax=Brucella anthropi TaxID=529 RepID=UPI00244C4101|nr:hypothetical protein [Brucella anthropi]MDG9791959.1 hypothetical protein [Brucella anthropi]MDH0583404.1 hypothetical protein [Brucella anthropi]MDH0818227.1 hypothetical protein [Brucella anthropi]MDH2085395.1 hypothetical protein [Brucella anthropi]